VRIIHTNKSTSLGLLFSSMTHEINNPHVSIRFTGHINCQDLDARIWISTLCRFRGALSTSNSMFSSS
jgi:hypothetical protein